jgi:predicted  nucleic acid-binding Zn-ribbon protein
MLELLKFLKIISLSESGNDFYVNSGSIASIASLLITIFIFLTIRKVKRFYIFTARVPELITELEELASRISDSLNDYESNKDRIEKDLGSAENRLNHLKYKINSRPARKSILSLIKSMKKLKPNGDTEKIRAIHIRLYKIVDEIKELQKDFKWEK